MSLSPSPQCDNAVPLSHKDPLTPPNYCLMLFLLSVWLSGCVIPGLYVWWVVGCCLTVRVVSLSLYLDIIHVNFLYLCWFWIKPQPRWFRELWEMVQLYVFYSCCWFLCHQDNYLLPNVLYVSLFVYRVLLLVHLYKYRYMYWSKDIHVDKCKNCLHRNWSIRAFVFSKNILQGKKNFMYVWMFMYICFLENLL